MKQIIRNIISLQVVSPADLANVIIVPGRGAYFPASLPAGEELSLTEPAELKDSTKTVDRTKIHTVQLTARLADRIDVDGYPMCFIATSADGTSWLIGSAYQPYPVSDIEDVMPSRFADRSVCTLTVQWTGIEGLLKIRCIPSQ